MSSNTTQYTNHARDKVRQLAEGFRHLGAITKRRSRPGLFWETFFEVFDRIGQPMPVAPLTFAEGRTVVRAARRAGGLKAFRPKHCWFNAQRLVLLDFRGTFQYVEGYCCAENSFPCPHAWLLINGKVVDLTLRPYRRPYDYFGVVVPVRLVRMTVLQVGRYSPVTEGPFQAEVFGAATTRTKQEA